MSTQQEQIDNTILALRTEAKLIDARIAMAENHKREICALYDRAADTLHNLKRQKSDINNRARTLIES